jgi:hypothetical protein
MKPKPTNDPEIQRFDLERERFKLEKQNTVFRYIAILGGIGTFAWSSFSYFDTAHREREKQVQEQASATAVQKVAGMQPFLTRQLLLLLRLPRRRHSLRRVQILQSARRE